MRVAISRIHFPVTTLGPGRRVGVWFQGCSIQCPGCISRDTWETGLGEIDMTEVTRQLLEFPATADGLTISGGEPFDQPEALAILLRGWREISRANTLVYSGREPAELKPWLADNPGLIDALISGPYSSEQSQTLALRGSDNQELHILTTAGRAFAEYDRALQPSDRRLDVMFDDDGSVWFAGIPARGDLARLRRLMADRGHAIETSQMRRSAAL